MKLIPGFPIFGGSHPHALVDGPWVALRHGRDILTHIGPVPLPPGEPWGVQYLVCTTQPLGFRFCGQAHDTLNRLWEWAVQGGWLPIDGPNAGRVVYTRRGILIAEPIVYPDGSVSSQGYRYVDEHEHPVTGQDTAGPERGVSQFTRLGDLLIGQGHARGGVVVATADGILRELWAGAAYDIKVDWRGSDVAIAFWDITPPFTAYAYRGTLDDLRALPPQAVPAPPPPVLPPAPALTWKKCEVTVERFTLTPAAKIPDGVVAQFFDRENPHGAHVRIWVEGGSMRFAIDYPGAGPHLEGTTGARRPVR